MRHALTQENNPHIYQRNRHFSKKKAKKPQNTLSQPKVDSPLQPQADIPKSNAERFLIKLGSNENINEEQWSSKFQHSHPSRINFLSYLGYSMDSSRLDPQQFELLPSQKISAESQKILGSDSKIPNKEKNQKCSPFNDETNYNFSITQRSNYEGNCNFFLPQTSRVSSNPKMDKSENSENYFLSCIKSARKRENFTKDKASSDKKVEVKYPHSKLYESPFSNISKTSSCFPNKLSDDQSPSQFNCNDSFITSKKQNWMCSPSGSVLVGIGARVTPFEAQTQREMQAQTCRQNEGQKKDIDSIFQNISISFHGRDHNPQRVLQPRENNINENITSKQAQYKISDMMDQNIFLQKQEKKIKDGQLDLDRINQTLQMSRRINNSVNIKSKSNTKDEMSSQGSKDISHYLKACDYSSQVWNNSVSIFENLNISQGDFQSKSKQINNMVEEKQDTNTSRAIAKPKEEEFSFEELFISKEKLRTRTANPSLKRSTQQKQKRIFQQQKQQFPQPIFNSIQPIESSQQLEKQQQQQNMSMNDSSNISCPRRIPPLLLYRQCQIETTRSKQFGDSAIQSSPPSIFEHSPERNEIFLSSKFNQFGAFSPSPSR